MASIKHFSKSTPQGTATIVWATIGKALEGKGAKYVEDCAEGNLVVGDNVLTCGYAPFVSDEEAGKTLWKVSCEMVGVKDE
jgi:hypothetical protein